MKQSQWILELVDRVKDDRQFSKYDSQSAQSAALLEKSLTTKQLKLLRNYLDNVEGMALVRMIHAYNLGVEHGKAGK